MSETLTARPALAGIALPGRHGTGNGAPGVTLRERTDLGVVAVMARKGQGEALRMAVASAYRATLPDTARYLAGQTVGFVGTGPGQWLAVSASLGGGALAVDLTAKLAGLASVSDQGDGRAVIRIAGPRARDVLAKGLPIDLHPSVFAPGSAATSIISLMGVTLWQVDETPAYDLVVFRSLAVSFWSWLTDSAAEYGYEVVPATN